MRIAIKTGEVCGGKGGGLVMAGMMGLLSSVNAVDVSVAEVPVCTLDIMGDLFITAEGLNENNGFACDIEDIPRNLIIEAPGVTSLDFPNLKAVGGFITQGPASWYDNADANFPELLSVGGCSTIGKFGLNSISLPKLERVGEFEITEAAFATMHRLELPALKYANFLALSYTGLESLDAPNLEAISLQLEVRNNFELENITMQGLRSVQVVDLIGNGGLQRVDMPGVTGANRNFYTATGNGPGCKCNCGNLPDTC
jgi:hypothetical protein